MKQLGFAIIVALLLTGCGSKKRTVNQRTNEVDRTHSDNSTNETATQPKDSERFVKFPIASTEEYIETFAEIAQQEMRAYGIPASITLAQGILESGSGRGELTLKTNNHFGIKCHTGWEGEYAYHDDDEKGECFRKYNHPMYSFRDHSVFLSTRSRYAFLFNYRRDDYKKWAHGLRQAGYATDRRYPEKLISIIERYGLDRYDEDVVRGGGVEVVRQPKEYEVFTHVVAKGDTLYALSRKYAVSVEELKQLNNLDGNTISVGQELNIRREKAK
ncbi:glucosaminidase domain-containing protein [Flagellimonas meishanensis]|uniref:glucosaminidase domain-containing protein n=1 Tax=Flagellimonas meishanensis TaxID=2873264 RepID=UPI001CA789F7|nr:glucosaminidase domain-containing protein [[Muricauda] meishanensis]